MKIISAGFAGSVIREGSGKIVAILGRPLADKKWISDSNELNLSGVIG